MHVWRPGANLQPVMYISHTPLQLILKCFPLGSGSFPQQRLWLKVQLYPGSRTAGQPLSLKSSGMDTVCVGVMVMFVSFSMLVSSRRSGGWVWGVDGCCSCSYLIACQYARCYAGANVTPSNPHHSLFTMKPRVRHTINKQKQKKRKEE